MGAFGLYTHIERNRRISLLVLAGFVVLLQAVCFSFALLAEAGGEGGFQAIFGRAVADMRVMGPMGLAAAGLWLLVAWKIHERLTDTVTGSREMAPGDAARVLRLLEPLCISRGMVTPRLKCIDEPAMNAYAGGLGEKDAFIGVTRGLLAHLDDAELAAVLAHELTHIRNRDTQMLTIAVIFAGMLSFIGDMTFRNWDFGFGGDVRRRASNDRNSGGGGALLAIALAAAILLISWGLSVLSRFALSRAREYMADAGAVELTKDPEAMISALRKISADPILPQSSSRMGAFFIENPVSGASGWLSTHPSMEDRIAALVRYAGAKDDPPPAPGIGAPPGFLPQDGVSPLDARLGDAPLGGAPLGDVPLGDAPQDRRGRSPLGYSYTPPR